MKKCTGCKKEYPATPEYFNRNIAAKSGLATRCKECTRAYSRKYWRKRNKVEKEKIKIREDLKNTRPDYKLGQLYEVEYNATERQKAWFKGVCKFVNDRYIMLENKRGIRECFLIIDFVIDKKIKELS